MTQDAKQATIQLASSINLRLASDFPRASTAILARTLQILIEVFLDTYRKLSEKSTWSLHRPIRIANASDFENFIAYWCPLKKGSDGGVERRRQRALLRRQPGRVH